MADLNKNIKMYVFQNEYEIETQYKLMYQNSLVLPIFANLYDFCNMHSVEFQIKHQKIQNKEQRKQNLAIKV